MAKDTVDKKNAEKSKDTSKDNDNMDNENEDDEDDETEGNDDKKNLKEAYREEDQPAAVTFASVLDLKKLVKESLDTEAMAANTKEHVSALFGAEHLSEDFKGRANVLWGASVSQAVEDRVTTISEQIFAKAEEFITEQKAAFETALSERVDAYLSYVAEQWVEDNRLAIETGIRAEIAEGFMQKLHDVFAESYIEVPESKVDLVEDLNKKVEKLTADLKEAIDTSVEERARANGLLRGSILTDLAEGLADTQKEKLRSLTESVAFESEDQFRKAASVIKENYFKPEAKTEGADKEVNISESNGGASVDEGMKRILEFAARSKTR